MRIEIDDHLSMELLREEFAEELFQQVELNGQYLRQWLPWLDSNNTVADTRKFILDMVEQHESGRGPVFALFYDGNVCGINGFHKIDKLHKKVGIGYWVAEPFAGRGLITKSSREILKIGFEDYGLHKLEIHCATKNSKSRAVAERLGFTYEATLRDCEWLYTKHVSHAIYSMLNSEYQLLQRSEKRGR